MLGVKRIINYLESVVTVSVIGIIIERIISVTHEVELGLESHIVRFPAKRLPESQGKLRADKQNQELQHPNPRHD